MKAEGQCFAQQLLRRYGICLNPGRQQRLHPAEEVQVLHGDVWDKINELYVKNF